MLFRVRFEQTEIELRKEFLNSRNFNWIAVSFVSVDLVHAY